MLDFNIGYYHLGTFEWKNMKLVQDTVSLKQSGQWMEFQTSVMNQRYLSDIELRGSGIKWFILIKIHGLKSAVMSPVSSHLSEFHSIVKLNIRDRYDYLDYHKRWKKVIRGVKANQPPWKSPELRCFYEEALILKRPIPINYADHDLNIPAGGSKHVSCCTR